VQYARGGSTYIKLSNLGQIMLAHPRVDGLVDKGVKSLHPPADPRSRNTQTSFSVRASVRSDRRVLSHKLGDRYD